MAAQVLFTAAVVGTVALNAADIILNRLHKKKAKKALIEREKEKGRVADENSSEEEETSSEEEETTHVITSQDRDRYGNRLRQSSPANNRSDTSVQGPQYSRNRSPLPGSTNMVGLLSICFSQICWHKRVTDVARLDLAQPQLRPLAYSSFVYQTCHPIRSIQTQKQCPFVSTPKSQKNY
jgi:hypothetical protein